VRTPQISPTSLLVAVLAGAFGALVGGSGGLHVQVRALRMRVDGHDDELEQTNRRLSRRDGQEGRDRQRAQGSKLEKEAAELLARLEAGGGSKGNGHAKNDRELLASLEQLPDRIFGPRGGKRDPDEA
jgi:hypothetical protein